MSPHHAMSCHDRYRNAAPSEPHKLYDGGCMHFPGFSVDSVKYLIEKYPSFVGIGIDTLSLDPGQ